MSENTDRAAWQVTTDHEQIREWTEEHETVPVLTEGQSDTSLRVLSNPDDNLGEELSWDQFFERFETESLALRYRETAAGGGDQPAHEFVDRDEIESAEIRGEEEPDSVEAQIHEHDSDGQSAPPDGSGVTQVDSETAARSDESSKESDTLSSDAEVDDAAE